MAVASAKEEVTIAPVVAAEPTAGETAGASAEGEAARKCGLDVFIDCRNAW